MAAPSKLNAAPKKKVRKTDVSLPKGWNIQIRWNDTTKRFFFVERAPHQRIVRVDGMEYYVWMPWTYYKVNLVPASNYVSYDQYHVAQVFVSPTKVKDDSELYRLPLSNVYGDTTTCYSSHHQGEQRTWEEQLAASIMTWEQMSHNYDNWEELRTREPYLELARRGEPPYWDSDEETCDCCAAAELPYANTWDSYHKVMEEWEKLSLDEVKKLPWHTVSTVRKVTNSKAQVILRPGLKFTQ